MAGQETTTTTIIWGIIYLIHNQDKQERLQEELDKIIGSNRLVTNDDRANLNYTMATIQEIQRIANISPLVIRRKNFKEFEINGHLIPQGSAIIPMISVLLADEKVDNGVCSSTNKMSTSFFESSKIMYTLAPYEYSHVNLIGLVGTYPVMYYEKVHIVRSQD
uniref:Cytochrome P450 n=1 Tax=Acrobeloides nanus TaxID=290746 RepID=A0A914DZ40_9BILA